MVVVEIVNIVNNVFFYIKILPCCSISVISIDLSASIDSIDYNISFLASIPVLEFLMPPSPGCSCILSFGLHQFTLDITAEHMGPILSTVYISSVDGMAHLHKIIQEH